MKLKNYIKQLQEICDKYPNLNVIYSSDEEGNNYDYVAFGPTICHYKDCELTAEADFEEFGIKKPNAVIIN
mgnify:FL=1